MKPYLILTHPMKPYLILTLIAALAVPAWADFTSDIAAAGSKVASDPGAARAAFQAVAVKYSDNAPVVNTANCNASICLAKQGKLDEAMSELAAQNNEGSRCSWTMVAFDYKKLSAAQAEAMFASAFSGAAPSKYARSLFITAYVKERNWAKVKTSLLAAAAEGEIPTTALLSDVVISKSRLIFASQDEQVQYLNDLLRVIPATEANAKVLGIIKSQLELLK